MYAYVDGIPDADSRHVYTYTGGDRLLTRPENAFHGDNLHDPATGTGSIDPAWFYAGLDRNELLQLIRWGRGVDIDDEDDDGIETEGRISMGASLHGRPLLIRYGPQDPDITISTDVIFTLDNDGYFHAARTDDTGDDARQLGLFSFLPSQLLSHLRTLRANQPGTGDDASRNTIKYGLDGGLSAWLRDTGDDGRIDPGTDRAYVYFNQRRGGDSIYALDVSTPAAPRFLWRIVSGSAGFAELGSTWSRPVHARVTLQIPPDAGPRTRDVLIFGGGYDTRHDIPGLARSAGDGTGRAIYIVDAETGQRLWWAGPAGHPDNPDLPLTGMTFCIPSGITVIDSNGDEQADVLLVGDLGGQLWRFDISDGSISGGVIADLQGTGGASNNRRFFHAPDASVAPGRPGTASLLIALGSGYQAHPLDTVTHERFYVIRDRHWPGPPRAPDGSITYERVTEDDLLDLTDTPTLDPDRVAAVDAARLEHGWYLSLRDAVSTEYLGEKILAPATIAGGTAMFTTYIPGPSVGACGAGNGTGRVYAVDITQGSPAADLDGSGAGTPLGASDRFQELGGRGIPPGVTVVYPASENTGPLVIVGPQITRIPMDNPLVTTYWFEE